MKRTLLVASVFAALFTCAVAAQAEVTGSFTSDLAIGGFEPNVVAQTQNVIAAGPTYFSGGTVIQAGTIGGQVQASTQQYVDVNPAPFGGSSVLMNSSAVQSSTGWWGFAGGQVQNEAMLSTPGTFSYTATQATVFGNAGASSSAVVFNN